MCGKMQESGFTEIISFDMYSSLYDKYPVFLYPEFSQGSLWGVVAVWMVDILSWDPLGLPSSPSMVAAIANDCDILCLLTWQEIFHFSYPQGWRKILGKRDFRSLLVKKGWDVNF